MWRQCLKVHYEPSTLVINILIAVISLVPILSPSAHKLITFLHVERLSTLMVVTCRLYIIDMCVQAVYYISALPTMGSI